MQSCLSQGMYGQLDGEEARMSTLQTESSKTWPNLDSERIPIAFQAMNAARVIFFQPSTPHAGIFPPSTPPVYSRCGGESQKVFSRSL